MAADNDQRLRNRQTKHFIRGEDGPFANGPNSEGRSYAQLTPDEKDAISHRGNALAEMEKELPEFLKKAE